MSLFLWIFIFPAVYDQLVSAFFTMLIVHGITVLNILYWKLNNLKCIWVWKLNFVYKIKVYDTNIPLNTKKTDIDFFLVSWWIKKDFLTFTMTDYGGDNVCEQKEH